MMTSLRARDSLKYATAALFCCFLLVSCAIDPPIVEESLPEAGLSIDEQIEHLLQQARLSPKFAAQFYQLQAIELLIQKGQNNLAKQLLMSLSEDQLLENSFSRYCALRSHFELRDGEIDQALMRLNNARLLAEIDTQPLALQVTISDLRARALSLKGAHLASAQERIFIAPLLEDELQIARNQQALWQSLMYLSKEEINGFHRNAYAADYRAWLELAVIAKDSQSDLNVQIEALRGWSVRWANHPAANAMPGGLQFLEELAANQPQHIALLLPLSGKLATAGRSVRDGFLAAYYQSDRRNQLQISIFDTQNADVVQQYKQAVEAGAELIIGPLRKSKVRLLIDLVELPVPTLALNYVDDYGKAPDQLYQFGLAATDEAVQVAKIASLENKHKAMILAPQSDWGNKVSLAFSEQWQQLGGDVVAQGFFEGQADYSPIVKDLFNLRDSEIRSRNLSQLIGQDLEFEPRRRQDVDMIFMLARPHEARTLKPMLAFHYGGDIPVYATSHIYGGDLTADKDVDLNGIKFSETPWLLAPENALLTSIIKSDMELDNGYLRMLALGVDAFRLAPRLRQLDVAPESPIYGETGTLYLGQERKIIRQLMWAQFKRGKAQALPLIAYNAALQSNYGMDAHITDTVDNAVDASNEASLQQGSEGNDTFFQDQDKPTTQ